MQLTHEKLKIKLLSNKGTLPVRSTEQAAGLDIFSAENAVIPPGMNQKIHTDIAMQIPHGHYGQLQSRSGLALRDRITVDAGVIDSDYRGEVALILDNKSDKDFTIQQGDRLAQLIIMELPLVEIQKVKTLDNTVRGKGGFGSTGVGLNEDKPTVNKRATNTTLPSRSPRISIQPTTAQAAKLHNIE